MKKPSIRLRLTLWYTAVLLAIQMAVSFRVFLFMHNAIQNTPGNGRIEIRTGRVGNGQVAIDIIDNGPGIPESERARVFERFYRLDKARSRKEGGFGLGLAIAQWAVELNGGTIGFHDKEGSGAWCRIVLPGE